MATTAVLVIGSIGAVGLLTMKRRASLSWEPPQDWRDRAIELMWSESSPFAGGTNPPIAALSFFDCDVSQESLVNVEVWIKERVRAIANANPWIAGRLVNLDGKRQLVYPSQISDNDLDRLLLINPPDFSPKPSMSPDELSTEYQKVELGTVYDKNDVLVSRFVTARTARGLSVLFIMSHVVGDGITFYSIFNQLSSTSKIKALSAKRKPQFEDPKVGVLKVLGMDMNKALLRPSSIISMLKGMLMGAPPRLIRSIVDDNAIEAAKAEAKQAGEVPFVSSNDILTSAFANKIGADVCIMAINLRCRIDGIDESDMGNYENGLLFDTSCSATPSNVRRAMMHPAFKCRETPLPSLSAAFSSKYCLISNWASGSASLELPYCTESLHQPVFNVSSITHSLPFDVAMVFRAAGARKGRLGFMWFTRTPGAEHEMLAGLPLECKI